MARWDPPHVIPRVKLCLYVKFLACNSILLAKVPILVVVLDKESGCGPIDLLSLVTLILNIYGFVGLTATVQA